MKKCVLSIFIMMMFLCSGCTWRNQGTSFASLSQHSNYENKEKNTVTVEVPGDISEAQKNVRFAAAAMGLKEHNVSEKRDGFLLFSNIKRRTWLLTVSNEANNRLGVFFYYNEDEDVTNIVITEILMTPMSMLTSILVNNHIRDKMADLIIERYNDE